MIARDMHDGEGEDAARKEAALEIYSKISMKFLDGSGSAYIHTLHDNACSYADRHVGGGGGEGEAPRADPVHVGREKEREISHYAFLSQAAVIILHIAGGGVPRLPLPIFPARQKGTAGNLALPGHTCARMYTVTLTLLLQFNAFHREAGAGGGEGYRALKIRARDPRVYSVDTERNSAPSSFEFMMLGKHLFFRRTTAPRKRVIEFVTEYIYRCPSSPSVTGISR